MSDASGDIGFVDIPSFDSRRGPGAGDAPPPAAARYTPVREIGRGGMGAVFEAWDTDLRRRVAVKVLRDLEPTAEFLARFREEAQVTAQLEHPAIMPIHDIGVDPSGRIFLVMKFVEGRTLQNAIDALIRKNADAEREFTLVRRIQILQQVAHAMAFAHDRGVVHRDLKPTNLMIGRHGEVQIMDWGLAKVAGQTKSGKTSTVRTDRGDDETTKTIWGTIQGTPTYMAPEQAEGDEVDHRADLYALGAILYELISLRPPVKGQSTEEILERTRNGRIEPLPMWVPRELRAIVTKAMALRREARYHDAGEFAEDLQAYLEHHPGIAWRETRWTRVVKWMRRHPATTRAMAATFITAFVVAVPLLTMHTVGVAPGHEVLCVGADPPGAMVRVLQDGEVVSRGAAPFVNELPAGFYTVRVEAEGRRPEEIEVRLEGTGSLRRFTVHLRPLP